MAAPQPPSERQRRLYQLAGSGIRGFSTLSAVRVRIGGTESSVLWAGPQGQLAGLDQVNVLVPKSLAGRGEVPIALTVDGKPANVVTVNVR
jgi:uncharacterized protein (TIGR03437 family)